MVELASWLKEILRYREDDAPRTIDDRYLSFARRPRTWDQLTDQQYQELIETLKHQSWQGALAAVLKKHWGNYLARYNTSPERLAFIDQLLPENSDLTVLDIGCSFGNISQALARRYQRVVAVDTPDNIVRWVNALKAKEGLVSLESIGIENLDFAPLPFKDGSFDLVVLAMTLQWIGSFDLNRSADEIQRSVVRDIFRVLKPGGTLALLDTNRYKFNYFLGEPDGSALPYASLLPRKLADLYARAAKRLLTRNKNLLQYVQNVSLAHDRYRNYKHSFSCLNKYLRKQGFAIVRTYLPVPDVRFQKVFIPLSDEREAERVFGQGYLRTILKKIKGHYFVKMFFRLAIRLGFSRYLADGYLIIAEK